MRSNGRCVPAVRRTGVLGGLLLLCGLSTGPAFAATDRLPDLGMAQLADFKVDTTTDGRRVLRYSATIVNVGAGAYELHGQRSGTETTVPVSQRIYDDVGGSRSVSTSAVLVYGGDGHNHWHVRDLEQGELTRLDNGVKVGTSQKHGFCFWDNVRYRTSLVGAPNSPFYASAAGCGSSTSLEMQMGLSIGWGDRYPATLPDQLVDITGLSAGRYRLTVTADAGNWFAESNESNNTTWVDLQLKGNGRPRVTGYGPVA